MSIILSAIAFCSIVLWQLLCNGPFGWHMARAPFWQGGIEALCLIGALGAAQCLNAPRWRLVCSALLAELYLRRHAVDAALLVDWLYFELIFALGAGVMRKCGSGKPVDVVAYLRCFVLGFGVWSVCAWTASALGFGSVRDLRWLTCLLILPALYARSTPWCVFVARRVEAMPAANRALAAVLGAWFLILFAHSAVALGYDSHWYGMRGDRVLVGAGSAFSSMGLVSPVYYFPKIYELFVIPVSGLGSSSVIQGVTIGHLGLIAAACYAILPRLGLRDTLPRLAAVALVIGLPAAANSALDTKPDLLAAFLLVFAWMPATDFVRTRSPAAALWFAALLVLATQAKLTAIPFAAALFLATAIAAACTKPVATGKSSRAGCRAAAAALILALGVAAFATARTWLLTGVPTIGPDPLLKLWLALGFTLRFPSGTLQWSFPTDWGGIPMLIVDLLFRPQLLEHIVITWTGNVWLWLGAIAIAAAAIAKRGPAGDADGIPRATWPGIGLTLAAFFIMLCWGFGTRGGDGNYFVAGIVPALLLGTNATWRRLSTHPHTGRALLFGILGFALFQAGFSFLSTAWSAGTREFDLDFTRGPHQYRDDLRKSFAENGIAAIAAKLRSLHRPARVVGCTQFGDALGMQLPASFENAAQIHFAHRDFIDTPEHFAEFLKADRIEYLLLPQPTNTKAECNSLFALDQVASRLDPDSALHDQEYVLYDLGGLRTPSSSTVLPNRRP